MTYFNQIIAKPAEKQKTNMDDYCTKAKIEFPFYVTASGSSPKVNIINMDIEMDTERRNRKRKHGCVHFLMDSLYSCNLVSDYYYKYMHKEPCMKSSQTGEAWMNEVLNGHPIRSVNAFRMHPNVFLKLCGELESSYGLKSSDKIMVVEKLGIFVYTLALGVSNRDVGERFQRSGETISRVFHEVLEAITGRSKGFHGLAHYMGCDELRDVRGSVTNNEGTSSGTSNEMKKIRNDIATSIWNARRR
ncbi:hypothetical protein CTI12_AA079800 [Artemisia annua]|uniref:DUF8040 domain-containing protein n=1 Tax=Artemisia annua TaxID=35608 RepID=A0A2U1Q2W1_ARTAN|nr:hypothetical protein CTI12_AA079800 [Artemisia annua]